MILAVAGGKGGVGKSTVAFNLAAALEAVVVDADLGMADLPTAPGPDLHDVLAGRAAPLEAVRELGDGFGILPCGRSLAGARAADVHALGDVIRAVEAAFGDVVVDCPAGRRADVGVPLAVADACLLVTTPDAAALSDAVRTRALARELDAGLLGVVLNRTTTAGATDAVARLLGAPAVALPPDSGLARSTVTADPVVSAAPGSRAATQLEAVAAMIRTCGLEP